MKPVPKGKISLKRSPMKYSPLTSAKKEFKSPGTAKGSTMGGSIGKHLKDSKTKKGGDIAQIRFKSVNDIAFDYLKFADCSINQVFLELHGNNLTIKSAEYMGKFLESVSRIDKLSINLSISAITKEHVEPLAKGFLNLPDLKEFELDLSRSKIETEAMEILCEAIASLSLLRGLSISVEKQSIFKKHEDQFKEYRKFGKGDLRSRGA